MAKKASSSKKKGSGKTTFKRTLPEIIIALVLIIVVGLYYYDVPPLNFDLGIGFKYSQATPTPTPTPTPKPPVGSTDGRLEITFINVGQGDSVLIELPDGRTMLIDGGNKGSFTKDETSVKFDVSDTIINVLSDKGITELDYVILTHTDADHCGSLYEVIESDSVFVHTVYMPYVRSKYENDPIKKGTSEVPESFDGVEAGYISTGVYESFVQSVVAEGSEILYSETGTIIDGEGYRMTFVTPDPIQYSKVKSGDGEAINNVSPIILLEYGSVKVLLTGDAAKDGEEVFMTNYKKLELDVDVDLLKSGHHGSRASSNQFFLDVIKPEYVVVSAGYGNKYSHPEKETLDRYAAMNAEVYCTIDYGTITFIADSKGFAFEFEIEKVRASSYAITDPFGISYRFSEIFGALL